ncbi:ImmA/IrrE family metallo-endopeptidase [Rathayibacter sp. AY1A3]|uniref:ImmA/IrrE family metallo-endopeptidase n=1 Tax=Rathayibacter sp. AY1A3 TaxID=2080521 RepID=UPI000CE79EC8|nr:ImmA/IrrE family metallo-endopeptidase [Rathayibacter sp. AY1A3]PPF38064.1 hypothetical protein C5C10_04805 [Rathayibacter sp. AY1A3]
MTDVNRAARIHARLDAPHYVSRMIASLQARGDISLEEIRQDPIRWLEEWNEVDVFDFEPSRAESDSRCDVAGLYRGEETPPRIGIAFSETRQRMNFTALHELGHHLQMTDEELLNSLVERPDGGAALEEEACDTFAAAILIPEAAATSLLGRGTPSAESVVQLWQTLGTVSRSAVAMRARRQIDGDGHVVVLNADGIVTFATSTTAIRPGQRSDQTATAIWSAIERAHANETVTARGQFAYGTALAGDIYFMQATPAGTGFIIVAAIERVPWTLSIARHESAPYGRWYVCPHLACAAEFLAGPKDVCSVCHQPTCTECGRCACSITAPAEFLCTDCFLLKGSAEASATEGICSDCAA